MHRRQICFAARGAFTIDIDWTAEFTVDGV